MFVAIQAVVSLGFETHDGHRMGLWRRCVAQCPCQRGSRIALRTVARATCFIFQQLLPFSQPCLQGKNDYSLLRSNKGQKLCKPLERSVPMPHKYTDVDRRTLTTLDVFPETRTDDYWNVDGGWELSGPWTRFTQVLKIEREASKWFYGAWEELAKLTATYGHEKSSQHKERRRWAVQNAEFRKCSNTDRNLLHLSGFRGAHGHHEKRAQKMEMQLESAMPKQDTHVSCEPRTNENTHGIVSTQRSCRLSC